MNLKKCNESNENTSAAPGAHYISGTDIEMITTVPLPKKPEVMIFDLDGTISTLRQGWDKLMHDLMVQSILGGKPSFLSNEQYSFVSKRVVTLIDETAGVQTIMQMKKLCKLIESIGYIDSPDILSPEEYKSQYSKLLEGMIKDRITLIEQGKLAIDKVTMKGAIPFIEKMSRSVNKLYLISGSDNEDVLQEAYLMGYKKLMNGGIFGSLGDLNKDPKHINFKRIREEMTGDTKPGDCIVFGDGPVEMREAKNNGFIAVGVVSDEVKRTGINLKKRERLIQGGADYLIPDFSWAEALLEQ